jgi:hypothetical protein
MSFLKLGIHPALCQQKEPADAGSWGPDDELVSELLLFGSFLGRSLLAFLAFLAIFAFFAGLFLLWGVFAVTLGSTASGTGIGEAGEGKKSNCQEDF